LTVVFDPITPLVFLGLGLVMAVGVARLPLGALLRGLLPFWVLALSLLVTNALFATHPEQATIVWRGGPFTATVEGATIGLSLAERSMAIATFSVLLIMSTDPTELIRSLVQQAHFPPRFAYPTLAAYRFLPLLSSEFESIRLAHRLRGVGRSRGVVGWLREQGRMTLPLLANAIRRAERVALAMDARGFGSAHARTHFRRIAFTRTDVALVLVSTVCGVGILLLSAALGILRIWTGALTA
jgi:energy-coupling factor transport system permease protein